MIKTCILLILCAFTLGQETQRYLALTTHPTHGDYLTDGKGMSLYMFDLDQPFKSNCTGDCLRTWPAYTIEDTGIFIREGIKEDLIGMISREDGLKQLTYNQMPLYFYSLDRRAGDIRGHGIYSFGANWWLVNTTGMPVRTRDNNTSN
jgi:predicted lipoprotein with Yx(FWY)xxD motif